MRLGAPPEFACRVVLSEHGGDEEHAGHKQQEEEGAVHEARVGSEGGRDQQEQQEQQEQHELGTGT